MNTQAFVSNAPLGAVFVFVVLAFWLGGCTSSMVRREGVDWPGIGLSEDLGKNAARMEEIKNALKGGIGRYTLDDVKKVLQANTEDVRVNFPELASTIYPDRSESTEANWLYGLHVTPENFGDFWAYENRKAAGLIMSLSSSLMIGIGEAVRDDIEWLRR